MRNAERTSVVLYDIADAKRWRRVFKIMKEYGSWLQLSAFQCRLTDMKRAELVAKIKDVLDHGDDSFMLLDLGPSENVDVKVQTIGKLAFEPIEAKAQIF